MMTQIDAGVIEEKVLEFLRLHEVDGGSGMGRPLDGSFSLHRGSTEPDLYGMVDAVYILFTLDRLGDLTTRASREVWADRILSCQDEAGWFSLRNHRGHPREHSTAYAVGALRLLELDQGEVYLDRVRPLVGIRPILSSRPAFLKWIRRMGFNGLLDIPKKNVGWHHVWRGSHIGAGVPATLGMMRDYVDQWWPGQTNLDEWFGWYFDWLDGEVNPSTGLWQRAFWNLAVRRPTLIDLGGAAHFLWVYEAYGREFQYPAKIIDSTISLQRPTGLYREHPFCIDFDANYCIIRSYLQLPAEIQQEMQARVNHAIQRNFDAVTRVLLEEDLTEVYSDLHGPPGALAALVECTMMPGFSAGEVVSRWRHVLDHTWWL